MSAVVDAHLHYVSPAVFDALRRESASFDVQFEPGRTPRIDFPGRPRLRPIMEALYDLGSHEAYMRAQRIDRLVLGPLLDIVGYGLEPDRVRRGAGC